LFKKGFLHFYSDLNFINVIIITSTVINLTETKNKVNSNKIKIFIAFISTTRPKINHLGEYILSKTQQILLIDQQFAVGSQ